MLFKVLEITMHLILIYLNLTLSSFSGSHIQNYMNLCVQSLSRVQLFATLWTIAPQVSLSMEFSKQEYWSG